VFRFRPLGVLMRLHIHALSAARGEARYHELAFRQSTRVSLIALHGNRSSQPCRGVLMLRLSALQSGNLSCNVLKNLGRELRECGNCSPRFALHSRSRRPCSPAKTWPTTRSRYRSLNRIGTGRSPPSTAASTVGGWGRGNIKDGDSVHGLDFSYTSAEPFHGTVGNGHDLAKWKKDGLKMELRVGEIGSPDKFLPTISKPVGAMTFICEGPTAPRQFPKRSTKLKKKRSEVVVRSLTQLESNRFAIMQYRSIASASCLFSMNSPSVCAT
jgi:hypothetical protein